MSANGKRKHQIKIYILILLMSIIARDCILTNTTFANPSSTSSNELSEEKPDDRHENKMRTISNDSVVYNISKQDSTSNNNPTKNNDPVSDNSISDNRSVSDNNPENDNDSDDIQNEDATPPHNINETDKKENTSVSQSSNTIEDKTEYELYQYGTVSGPSGKETWYDLSMNNIVQMMYDKGYTPDKGWRYWIRSDGVKMFGDYVMVAANLETRPKGTILETSVGKGIVVDTGDFTTTEPDGIDIATDWKNSE